MAQGCTMPPPYAKCGRNHFGICHERFTGCYKCGQECHFIGEGPKDMQGGGNLDNRSQNSSVAPLNRPAPRVSTSRIGRGTNFLYSLNNSHEQENFPDVLTGMI